VPVWPDLLAAPSGLTDTSAAAWFDRLAERLLNGCRLLVNGRPHRLLEVEAYYHAAPHPDPFPHTNPIQLTAGRWYFHRTGGAYRGGSFKGLDVSIGDGTAYGGMLIRGLETPAGKVVDGPSLLVDHLLAGTRHPTVAALDAALGDRPAWTADRPLTLVAADAEQRPLLRCVRVGLSLRRRKYAPDDPALKYLLRSYRYVAEPRRTAKGKPHMVLPLLADGIAADEVSRLTGCPPAAVRRYAAAFEAGRSEPTPEPYYGRDLGTPELCRLYGLWRERWPG
jgi:hypothetical protein